MRSTLHDPAISGVKIAVLTAAVGTGLSGAAQAAFVSTAGSGFTPIVFDANVTSSHNLDVDGDSVADYMINSGSGSITIGGLVTGNLTVTGFTPPPKYAVPYSSPSDFSATPKASAIATIANFASNDTVISQVDPGVSEYLELELNSGTEGYVLGTLNVTNSGDPTVDATYTVTDFGYVETPEPASLTLLAFGAAGLAAFRRRRASVPA